jgi:LPS sulfotransferase NodH
VGWKRRVNAALARATGYELTRRPDAGGERRLHARPPAHGERLVVAPTFVICSLRSGSTLLRVLLNSHTQLHAPHELHLRYVTVGLTNKWSERAMRELGLDQRQLEHLLWDRVLHRQLAASGKARIVDKTPNNVFIVDRLRESWPDARFIFLLRHPAMIARSRDAVRKGFEPERNVKRIRRYCEAVERARQAHDGVTVRYEELTTDPAGVTQEICAHLGVRWEPSMLEYGDFSHGRYAVGLGDWNSKIKTGRIQPAAPPPPPEEIPAPLLAISRTWGYV